MSLLAPFCQQLKLQFTPKPHSPNQPVRYWTEKDRFNNSIKEAFVIILRTRGCSWARNGGCSMCGYFNDSHWNDISETQLKTQFHTAMKHYQDEPIVKLFNSGSFFDPQEMPRAVQHDILTTLREKAEKIAVESRPEYITKQNLDSLSKNIPLSKIEVGIGLETANDSIRKHAINKGFTLLDYKKAVSQLSKLDIGVKTYILIKPPLLTEQEAIDDSLETVQIVKDDSSTISFNPCNVQRHTTVEYFWHRHNYRPPWLWTVIDILQKSKHITNTRLQCDISGGGSPRGANNCPECNTTCLDSITQFSLTQDIDHLLDLECDCKQNWEAQCINEGKTFGSNIDYQKEYQ